MLNLLPKVLVFLLTAAVGGFGSSLVKNDSLRWMDTKQNPPRQTYSFEITEVQYSGWVGKSHVWIQAEQKANMAVLKQEALASIERTVSFGSSNNFIVAYLAPESLDGQPLNQGAVIEELPRPRFWREEYGRRSGRGQDCNTMVQVTLDSSGVISGAERVSLHPDSCDKTSDVIEAAKNIKFRPAMREGVPVAQRQLFLYRLH